MNGMTLVTTLNAEGVKTMSSQDMVAYINASRGNTGKEVHHHNFVATLKRRFPTTNFQQLVVPFTVGNGAVRYRTVYYLERREAELVAMIYSEALQEAVYDAWREAEAKVSAMTTVIPNFDDPIAAARAWIAEREASVALKLQLDTATVEVAAAQPKIEFYNTVIADEKDMPFDEAAKLLRIGRNKFVNWLKLNGYIQHNRVPYQRSVNSGWLRSSIAPRYMTTSGKLVEPTTYVTPKGLAYFHGKLAAGAVQRVAA